MNIKKINTDQPKEIFNIPNLIDTPEKNLNGKKLKNRKDNSLGELTKKFIKIALAEKSNIINLEEIKEKLKSKKRRIYDITNVFQGKKIIFDILFTFF